MLHDWIIQRFIDHTFELKCPEMRLCITPAYTTEVFNGSGRIWITTAGQLRFSMLAKLTCSDLQREWLPRLKMLGHPPKINPSHDSDYLQLKALDLSENRWISNWLIPCYNFIKGQYIELYGPIEYLTSPRKIVKGKEVSEFVILNSPNIPFEKSSRTIVLQDGVEVSNTWSLDHQVIKSQDVEVQFCKDLNNKTLLCTINPLENKSLLNNIAIHVVEALRFMLARPLRPIYYCTRTPDLEIIQLDGQITSDWRSGLLPPLNPITIEENINAWQIFSAYFDYLMNQSDQIAEFHPISLEYDGVMQSSKGSLEGFALALSVAIEALSKICAKIFKRENSSKKYDLKELKEYISKWNGDEKLKKRAIGAIEKFDEVRPLDILIGLKDVGLVTKEEIDSWQWLRNLCAHGGAYRDADKQKINKLATIASGLMHKIVLYEINYKGQFTNYSKANWPIETFGNNCKT